MNSAGTAALRVAPRGKTVEDSAASAAPKAGTGRAVLNADAAALGQGKHRRPNQLIAQETIPAKIVSQTQPAFPPWAKDLDVDGVVKLDAVIDEKGNVTETKLLSGPRVLRHAAERAIELWIFEPAQSDGKPTATHMELTVEFQR
jgi:TonB family protein